MKIKKGSAWLKRDFIAQLEQLFKNNHTVELDMLSNFKGREQFIKNLLSREELEEGTKEDIERQAKAERKAKIEELKERKYQNTLEREEEQLRKVLGV